MFAKTIRFAVAAVAVTMLAQPVGVSADTRHPSNVEMCMQSLKDTEATRAGNPVIGPKATLDFEQLVKAAEGKCKAGETDEALKILVEARGLVASE